jgi:hypothetical protein
MADSRDNHASTPIPEADQLDQEQPADPRVASDQTWPDSPIQDVDEADLVDQAQPVLTDPDEEYAPDSR